MPLKPGSSEKVVSENIGELRNSGYGEKQAAAIAYKKAEDNSLSSNRQVDHNGWIEIKGNPITKVGVFPYRGAEIFASPDIELDPNKIYFALRPPEELNKEDTLRSFELLPFIDEHEALSGRGIIGTPVEKKGMHGTTGQEIYFDYPYLKANLKIVSEELTEGIESGKRELSIGYDCDWEYQPGVFEGKSYDFIQRNVRGNQIALVHKGRSGDSVRVLDARPNLKFIFDTQEAIEMSEEKKIEGEEEKLEEKAETITLASIVEEIKKLKEWAATVMDKPLGEANSDMNESAVSRTEDGGESEETGETGVTKDEDEMAKKVMDSPAAKKVMDAAIATRVNRSIKSILGEVTRRDELAKTLSNEVGDFDFREMPLQKVAEYGVKKLNLVCDSGAEIATVRGYLQGISVNPAVAKEKTQAEVEIPSSLAKYSKGVF